MSDISLKKLKEKYEEEMKRKKHCKKISFFPKIIENKYITKLNCVELPLKNLKFILGPCSFYSFKFGGRNYFFFGEMHEHLSKHLNKLLSLGANSTNTLLFSSFVHSLVNQNKGDTFDLFFEQDYVSKEKREKYKLQKTKSPTINNISDQFQNCLYNKEKCEYENLRIHFIDFRKIYDRYSNELQSGGQYFDWIADEIFDILNSDIEVTENQSRVKKQILAVKNKHIRQKIIKYFDEIANNIINNIKSPSFMAASLMDIYAISRILRDFDDKIHMLSPKAFSGTAKNVLYYAGNAHIKNIVYFFKKFLKIKPEFESENCPNENFLNLNFEKYHYLFNY